MIQDVPPNKAQANARKKILAAREARLAREKWSRLRSATAIAVIAGGLWFVIWFLAAQAVTP